MQEDYVPIFPEVSVLSDRDVVTIRAVLKKGNHENNRDLKREAAQKVKEVIGIQSEMDSTAFLQQVLQDHTYLMTV
jgi:hypothetical protein